MCTYNVTDGPMVDHQSLLRQSVLSSSLSFGSVVGRVTSNESDAQDHKWEMLHLLTNTLIPSSQFERLHNFRRRREDRQLTSCGRCSGCSDQVSEAGRSGSSQQAQVSLNCDQDVWQPVSVQAAKIPAV